MTVKRGITVAAFGLMMGFVVLLLLPGFAISRFDAGYQKVQKGATISEVEALMGGPGILGEEAFLKGFWDQDQIGRASCRERVCQYV